MPYVVHTLSAARRKAVPNSARSKHKALYQLKAGYKAPAPFHADQVKVIKIYSSHQTLCCAGTQNTKLNAFLMLHLHGIKSKPNSKEKEQYSDIFVLFAI